MARTKRNPSNKGDVIRYITVTFAWCLWLLVTLSCISYHAYDRLYVIDRNHYATAARPACHNWCGPVGAKIALELLYHIGPGVFVGLILIAAFLIAWTKRSVIPQLVLRIIGGLMLIAIVSCTFSLMEKGVALPEGFHGGMLGNGLDVFLTVRFHFAGTLIILGLSTVVALLLVIDEIMLAVPGMMAHAWNQMPREQLAGAAAGAAGGLWNNLRDMASHLGNRRHMGAPKIELNKGRKKKNPDETATPVSPDAAKADIKNPKEDLSALGTAAAPVAAGPAAAADAVKPGTEITDADLDAPTPTIFPEPVVRKPAPAKTMMLPFKPMAPSPSPRQDFAAYKLPGVDLLDEAEPINQEGQEKRVREKARVLETTLESFGVQAKVAAIDTGPVVTLYELSLASGVKSAQVAALAKDIARALMSPPIRIIDNIPGKSTMGVEVPNIDRERVRLKELMVLGHDQIEGMALPMCLGKDASGNPLIEDLARIPHLLIAGTTGSGKSVCINSIIMTILLTQRPDHVKLIMVDPKMVEMQDYKCIPHLMAPIIDDMAKAESILEWATQKMDERYEIMSEAQVRHIKEFNKLSRDQIIERFSAITEDDRAKLMFHMPYIVIIIDELADLMMTSKEVEGHIVRIAQKARAVGIHLILATQRPEAQVVTGLIKSNMPGRICFQVRSRLDSRIMLDQSGGELLLGQGDMLVLRPTGGGLLRAQGSFVDDNEIKRVSKFLKEIAEPEFHPELVQLGTPSGLAEGEEKDPLYNDAVDIMIESGRGSVSLIQRRLNIGYSRASRLIDQMRRTGIVGAYKGSQASEVTVTKEEWEAMKLSESTSMAPIVPLDAEPGETGPQPGMGQSTGYAQQTNSTFDEDGDAGVPDEMPGEHRM